MANIGSTSVTVTGYTIASDGYHTSSITFYPCIKPQFFAVFNVVFFKIDFSVYISA
jgi:hypothetical protein